MGSLKNVINKIKNKIKHIVNNNFTALPTMNRLTIKYQQYVFTTLLPWELFMLHKDNPNLNYISVIKKNIYLKGYVSAFKMKTSLYSNSELWLKSAESFYDFRHINDNFLYFSYWKRSHSLRLFKSKDNYY